MPRYSVCEPPSNFEPHDMARAQPLFTPFALGFGTYYFDDRAEPIYAVAY
jgi:hypothetical protein